MAKTGKDNKQSILTPDFFNRPTVEVAKNLLGCTLVINLSKNKQRYIIVETEAYTQDDPACHAYRKSPTDKITPRASHLYKAPGTSYVYLIYGMYHCLNVVTEAENIGAAVLFRALEPIDKPSPSMPTSKKSITTNGPGKLCKALGITREHNAIDMTRPDSTMYLTTGSVLSPDQIIQTTRIGISKAADYPWRFYIKDNPYVSKK